MSEILWHEESVELTPERVEYVAQKVAREQHEHALKNALLAFQLFLRWVTTAVAGSQ